jgi:hypothetical protein
MAYLARESNHKINRGLTPRKSEINIALFGPVDLPSTFVLMWIKLTNVLLSLFTNHSYDVSTFETSTRSFCALFLLFLADPSPSPRVTTIKL